MDRATDAEMVKALRGYKGWPADLDALAQEAAHVGRLCHAVEVAEARAGEGRASRPQQAAQSNYQATFYDHLRQELFRVLGRVGLDG